MKKTLSKLTAIATISSTLFSAQCAHASDKPTKSLQSTPVAFIMPDTSIQPSFNDVIKDYLLQGRKIIAYRPISDPATKSKLCPYHSSLEIERYYQIRCRTFKRTRDYTIMEDFRSKQVKFLQQLTEENRRKVILELLGYRLARRPDDLDPDLARRLKIVEAEGIKQSCTMQEPDLSFIGVVIETYAGRIVGFNI